MKRMVEFSANVVRQLLDVNLSCAEENQFTVSVRLYTASTVCLTRGREEPAVPKSSCPSPSKECPRSPAEQIVSKRGGKSFDALETFTAQDFSWKEWIRRRLRSLSRASPPAAGHREPVGMSIARGSRMPSRVARSLHSSVRGCNGPGGRRGPVPPSRGPFFPAS